MSELDHQIVISIKPTPSPVERAAIIAAVTAALRSTAPSAEPPIPEPSRWSRAGRRDAMRGMDQEDDNG